MMYKSIFSTWLVYRKEIEIAFISIKWLCTTINDCVILEKILLNTRKSVGRKNGDDVKFQSVLVSKERGSQYHTATDRINIGDWLYPPSFISKGEPQQTVNNHRALLVGSSAASAWLHYQVIVDSVCNKDGTRTIVKDK